MMMRSYWHKLQNHREVNKIRSEIAQGLLQSKNMTLTMRTVARQIWIFCWINFSELTIHFIVVIYIWTCFDCYLKTVIFQMYFYYCFTCYIMQQNGDLFYFRVCSRNTLLWKYFPSFPRLISLRNETNEVVWTTTKTSQNHKNSQWLKRVKYSENYRKE